MHFLTEDDVRARCPQPGCTLSLAANERLTPSAAEFASRMRATIVHGNAVAKSGEPEGDGAACGEGMTRLDAATVVVKNHPRIVLRGKLDTLLASVILVQTRFDPDNRLSPYLKECLADMANWIMGTLSAEVSGNPCAAGSMGGMDVSVLHAVSREPRKYFGLDPFVPSAAMGANAALVNWLRALTREAEVASVESGLERADIAASLNRLSSAAYVLVILTLAAENGVDIAKIRRE